MSSPVISPDGKFYWNTRKEKWIPIELMPKVTKNSISDSVITGNVTQNITNISNDPTSIASAIIDVLSGNTDPSNPLHKESYSKLHESSTSADFCYLEERSLGDAAFSIDLPYEGIEHYKKAIEKAPRSDKWNIYEAFISQLRKDVSSSLLETYIETCEDAYKWVAVELNDKFLSGWVMRDLRNGVYWRYQRDKSAEDLERYITLCLNFMKLSKEIDMRLSGAYTGIDLGELLEELGHPKSEEIFKLAASDHRKVVFSHVGWPKELESRGHHSDGWVSRLWEGGPPAMKR